MTHTSMPLVVDLDGTLIRSDLLVESFFALALASPIKAFKTLFVLKQGRSAFKAAIAQQAPLDIATLPFNAPLLEWLRHEKSQGRVLYLASAADERYVQRVGEHLGIFSGFFASNGTVNLKSQAKADALCEAFGERQFEYVGNERADMAVWARAGAVVAVTADARFQAEIREQFPQAGFMPPPAATKRDYLKTVRVHQWMKNLLIFVPALAAQHLDGASLLQCLLAFASFSLCASSGYILNDLLDLQHDREHPKKRYRPLASGRVDLRVGAIMLVATLGGALVLSLFLPAAFLLSLVAYYTLTLLYSTRIKKQAILDVVLLSLLYSLRLIAGGAALGIPLSAWLLSFSGFFFLSLALIKRCSELTIRKQHGSGDPTGRGYRLTDLPILEGMAAASGYVAVLTSGLYINSPNVIELYSNPEYLWAITTILLYWKSRLLLLTHRGEMHDDPVLFAVRDRRSIVCGALILLILGASM